MDIYNQNSSEQLKEITETSRILSELYKELQDSLSDPNSSSEGSENIINNIETLTRVKKILINNYLQMNANAQQTSISQKIAYDETMDAIAATDNEIKESKKKIALLNEEKYNRLRLIEINNYYGSQYSNHQKIILYIIFLCSFFLITIILKNKNIISSTLFYWINIIVVSVFIIVIGYMLKEAYSHDNMNYDEYNYEYSYDFNYNKTILEHPVVPVSKKNSSSSTKCYVNGSKFCSNDLIFNLETQQCEIKPAEPPTDVKPPNSLSGDLYIVDKSNNTEIKI